MVKYGKIKRTRRTIKRKPWRKAKKFSKKRYSLASSRIARLPLNGFPHTYASKHNLIARRTLDPDGLSFFAVDEFRANDIYDSFVAVGSLPSACGTDQMWTYYNHCTVIASRITVTPITTSGTPASYPSIWGLMLNPETGVTQSIYTGGGVESILEQRAPGSNGRYRMGGLDGSDSNQMSLRTLSCTFSAKKYFKLKSIIGNKDLMCTVASSPPEQAIYSLWMVPATGVDNATPVTFMVKIQYTCVWTEPKQLGRS